MIDRIYLKRKNVVGFGRSKKITAGKKTNIDCITFFVEKKVPVSVLAAEDLIPAKIDDFPTDVIETGIIRALPASPVTHQGGPKKSSAQPRLGAKPQALSRLDPVRPAPPGVSIGHYAITAGTFGAVVKDNQSGKRLILSNNHVLANSNQGEIGDPILQPGLYDGGKNPGDIIGHLDRYVEILFEGGEEPPPDEPTCPIANLVADIVNAFATMLGSNYRVKTIKRPTPGVLKKKALAAINTVDAAVARPVNDGDIIDEILEIGKPLGFKTNLSLGTSLKKSGRTSGLTKGKVDAIDGTVSVEYGDGLIAVFEKQILSGIKSQGGDSGSLVLTEDNFAAGLLFAGSDTITVINPIDRVLSLLEIRIP